MVNRPAGGARSKKWAKEPHDWYVEPPWAVDMLLDGMGEGFFCTGGKPDLIIDPTCGSGNILDVVARRGHPTAGYDVVNRRPKHKLVEVQDFRKVSRLAVAKDRATSIICNPPYSYIPDIAEQIIRHACRFPVHRAAFLVPIAFLCSDSRVPFFRELRPSHVAYCATRRPTCPPGSKIPTMPNPFKGGMADYIWLVYTRPPQKVRTESVWI
jgi:hypothetical protein